MCRSRVSCLAIRLLVALLLVILVCACRSSSAPEPVTVSFGFPELDRAHFETLAEEFHRANPHIAITLVPHTWSQVGSLRASDANVLMVQQGYPLLQDRSGIMTLDDLIEGDSTFEPADFYPGLLDLLRADGKTWGIPAGVDPVVMYYHRDRFDAAGVPHLHNGWTWDDFLLAAQALTDAEQGVYGIISDPASGVPGYFVYQHGGDLVDDWDSPAHLTLDDPLTIEAMEWFADLIHVHGVHPTPAEMGRLAGGDAARPAFRCIAQGRAGMWIGGFGERGGLTWQAPWQFGAGMITLPRETYSATEVNLDAYVISAAIEDPEPAWRWISFLTRSQLARQAPARRSLAESVEFRQAVGEEPASVLQASMEMDIVRLNSATSAGFLSRSGFHQAYAQALQRIYSGEQTVAEALVAAQEALSR